MGRKGGRRILVIEEDLSECAVLQSILSAAGYDVVTALDGRTALRAITRQRFDVIVLDPIHCGAEGDRVFDRLSAMRSGSPTPVIAVTPENDPAAVMRGARAGVVDHVSRPFERVRVEAAVQQALIRSPEELDDRSERLARGAELYDSVMQLSREARLGERVGAETGKQRRLRLGSWRSRGPRDGQWERVADG